MSNKINFCEYSGNDCTWCKKRIFDNNKNIIKIHSHNEVDNSLKKDENGNRLLAKLWGFLEICVSLFYKVLV